MSVLRVSPASAPIPHAPVHAETHDVTAVGRFHVFGLALSFVFLVAVSVVGAVGGNPGFLVFTAAAAGYLAWDINRTVWRVTMSDGRLELRHLHRRRVVQLADVDSLRRRRPGLAVEDGIW